MDNSTKVYLAHDSFTQLGGAERIIGTLHDMYPQSPVATLVIDGQLKSKFNQWKIQTSILQPLYLLWPHFKHFLFLLPVGVWSLKIPDESIVISSSSLFLKALRIPINSMHINYCHTPVRFLWSEPNYVNQETPWIIRPIVKSWLKALKRYDYWSAQKVDFFIANSKEVQNRIKQYYNRESEIIYPCIDTEFWKPSQEKQDYFLLSGRLQAHKDNETVIRAFNNLGLPLHVVGTGSQEKYLRSISNSNITFLGRVSDETLRDEYSGAQAYIFPSFEDFGLVSIEAQACGTAVIGLGRGGSLETIIPNVTGVLVPEMTERTIIDVVKSWDVLKYTVQSMQDHAAQFSTEVFKSKVQEFVSNALSQ